MMQEYACLCMCLCSLLIIALKAQAHPMNNYPVYHFDPYDEASWPELPDENLSDLLESDYSFEVPETSYEGIQGEDPGLVDVDWPLWNTIQAKRKHRGTYYHDRETKFARVKLNRSKMTYDEWQNLVNSGDPIALQICIEYAKKYEKDANFALLKQKLKTKPKDPRLLAKLQDYNLSVEDYRRRRYVAMNRKPLSKLRRDRLNNIIKRVKEDIDNYNHSIPLRLIRSMETGRKAEGMRRNEENIHHARYAEGDADADRIRAKMNEMRLLLREPVLDVAKWNEYRQEVDDWMKLNLRGYVPFEEPYSRTSGESIHASREDHSQIEGDDSHTDFIDENQFNLTNLNTLLGSDEEY